MTVQSPLGDWTDRILLDRIIETRKADSEATQ